MLSEDRRDCLRSVVYSNWHREAVMITRVPGLYFNERILIHFSTLPDGIIFPFCKILWELLINLQERFLKLFWKNSERSGLGNFDLNYICHHVSTSVSFCGVPGHSSRTQELKVRWQLQPCHSGSVAVDRHGPPFCSWQLFCFETIKSRCSLAQKFGNEKCFKTSFCVCNDALKLKRCSRKHASERRVMLVGSDCMRLLCSMVMC